MSKASLNLAMAQMCSADRHEPNIGSVTELAARAVAGGAELLCLPEASGCMNRDRDQARRFLTVEDEDPFLAACRDLAARHNIWIHTGSTPMRDGDSSRFVNRSHLIDADGTIVARYDKIHLFDVDLPDGTRRRESDRYSPGTRTALADTPWGLFGLSVCYDLRFPHLYRDYAHAGASVIFVPSAFALLTGEAHWEVLLRARAIENGCFIVAAAQSGHHADGRHTWGHSLIINPWGAVMVDMEKGVGLSFSTLDLDAVEATRAMIPSLRNERPYTNTSGTDSNLMKAGE